MCKIQTLLNALKAAYLNDHPETPHDPAYTGSDIEDTAEAAPSAYFAATYCVENLRPAKHSKSDFYGTIDWNGVESEVSVHKCGTDVPYFVIFINGEHGIRL